MLRGRHDAYHRRGLALGMTMAALLAPVQLGVGDLLGRTVAENQPAKLAAIEGRYETEPGRRPQPRRLPDPGARPQRAERRGPGRPQRARLRRRPRDACAGCARSRGGPHAAGAAGPPVVPRDGRHRHVPHRPERLVLAAPPPAAGIPDRRTLLALAAAGPLAFVANELGWMVTELGRQPWVIYGVLRTKDAITTAPGLGALFAGFTLVYIALAAMTVWLLRRLATGAPAALAPPATAGGGRMTLADVLLAVLLDRADRLRRPRRGRLRRGRAAPARAGGLRRARAGGPRSGTRWGRSGRPTTCG